MILPVVPLESPDDELELDENCLMELEASLAQLNTIEEFNPDDASDPSSYRLL